MDVFAPLSGLAMTPGQQFARSAAPKSNRDSRQVEQVAQGLESTFFAMLCKEMRDTLEPGTLFGEDQGDVFGGLFDQFMGEHLAQGGPLGIAAMVRKQLTAQSPHEQHPGKPAAPARPVAGPTLF
jgi:Rod binding domain-containing protein